MWSLDGSVLYSSKHNFDSSSLTSSILSLISDRTSLFACSSQPTLTTVYSSILPVERLIWNLSWGMLSRISKPRTKHTPSDYTFLLNSNIDPLKILILPSSYSLLCFYLMNCSQVLASCGDISTKIYSHSRYKSKL